jgi:hypothetical protein
VLLRERAGHVEVRYVGADTLPPRASAEAAAALRDWLQLGVDAGALHTSWRRDPHLAAALRRLPGLRVLRQDPWECLVSFICSANNNIARISAMLFKLREAVGAPAGTHEGLAFFHFPGPAILAATPETRLRELGFGYRAKCGPRFSAAVTSSKLQATPDTWWRLQPRFWRGAASRGFGACGSSLPTRQRRLFASSLALGPRFAQFREPRVNPTERDTERDGVVQVADCVALFSLDQHEVLLCIV